MAAMKPVLNREAADQKAIGVLKRIDPDIEEVRCDRVLGTTPTPHPGQLPHCPSPHASLHGSS